MSLDLYQKHEAILTLLLKERDKNPNFNFTIRRSNRFSRLTNGYWFYGNDSYIALSFWSGSDWKNKTPNIIFSITEKGETHLEFTATDSEKKALFFEKEMSKHILKLGQTSKSLKKIYDSFKTDYLKSLKSLLIPHNFTSNFLQLQA